MQTVEIITPPALEPVAWAELKMHLRLDSDAEESFGNALLQTARETLENITGRAFINRELRQFFHDWQEIPLRKNHKKFTAVFSETGGQIYRFPYKAVQGLILNQPPLFSVENIKVLTTSENWQLIETAHYQVNSNRQQGCIIAQTGHFLPMPAVPVNGIAVEFTAGYGATAEHVPARLKQAILFLAAYWFENRFALSEKNEIPLAVRGLIQGFRLYYL